MSVDTSRLFVTPEGNGLRFFLDPVQIQKDKKRALLGLIRGSGGVYVTSVGDADVVLSVCETDEAERYAKEYKSTAVVDFDWINYCLSKRILAAGGNWAGYLITTDEADVFIKQEDSLQQIGLDIAAKSKLPSPVSPGQTRRPISPNSSPASRTPADKDVLGGTAEQATPARLPSTSSTPTSDFKALITALANIMPKAPLSNANPAGKTVSPTSSTTPSRSNQVRPPILPQKLVASGSGSSNSTLPKPNATAKPVSSPFLTTRPAVPSTASLRVPLPDTTRISQSSGSSSRLPTPISLPSPGIKSEPLVPPQPSPTEVPLTLFTHPTESRPLKLYLVSDLSHHREYTRVLQKFGAQLSLLADCDYAIIDQGSVRLHQVAGSGKPAVKPDWIAACHGQKSLLKPDEWTLKLDEDAPKAVIKPNPAPQIQPVPECAPQTARFGPTAPSQPAGQPPKPSLRSPSTEKVLWKAPTGKATEPLKSKPLRRKSQKPGM
ncbi:hypothetical protein CALVIDRAFT_87497 [Calocera viscosa TUFC12733]|uniref:BRCT domain-containing protein n=1 Tax=Calocera viscosa (strain TUFC12733) TaxID=1330018 RepID=A0A167N6V9_CALVF|nr:hypothetical protein CALVIDRAFT_87497 [Calocera viscosa TUFC12733]